MVVTSHGTLTFIDLNGDSGLVDGVGSEGLSLLGRNSGIPHDQGCHDTTGGLHTHVQGIHIQK